MKTKNCSLIILFLTSMLTSYGQFWRSDGDVDIIADSIEKVIVNHKPKTTRIIYKSRGINDKYFRKQKFIVRWINDSIVETTAKARNTTYHGNYGEYTKDSLILSDGLLCSYNVKSKTNSCWHWEEMYKDDSIIVAGIYDTILTQIEQEHLIKMGQYRENHHFFYTDNFYFEYNFPDSYRLISFISNKDSTITIPYETIYYSPPEITIIDNLYQRRIKTTYFYHNHLSSIWIKHSSNYSFYYGSFNRIKRIEFYDDSGQIDFKKIRIKY